MNPFIQNQFKDGGTEFHFHPILFTVKHAAHLLGTETTTFFVNVNTRTTSGCKVGAEILETSVVFHNPKDADQVDINKFYSIPLVLRIEKV